MRLKLKFLHPVTLVRILGFIDGVSLLVLLGIAMPLKYAAGMPLAVTIVGTAHGYIFVSYLLSILYAQIRVQWQIWWSLVAVLSGFIPFANFVLDRVLKKRQPAFAIKPLKKIWLVYAIILFTFLDLFTQLPVMSTFAISLGASAMMAGFIVGMYSLTNTFGNVLSGMMTDKYGAYQVLAGGLLMTSCTLLLYNLVDNATGLLAVRFLHGLLGGLTVPAAFTYVANQAKMDKQGSQSAITGSFVGIAAIVGPAYSGMMASKVSVPFVFTSVAGLGFILFVCTLLILRSKKEMIVKKKRNSEKLLLNRGMVQAFSGAFFLMFSQGALAYLLPQHVESLGYSSRLSGTLMSMFGLIAVALFVLPSNKIFDRVHPLISFSIGLGLMGISQILIGQLSDVLSLYIILAVYGIGFALLFPSMNAMLAHATTKENRGKAYGYFYAFFSVGVVVGSSGLGLLSLSLKHLFLVTGLILLASVTTIVCTGIYREKRSQSV